VGTYYDENTIKEFVAENRDHLEEIEPDLLMMEKKGSDTPPEIINRVFRAIHSIKGSSAFLDFPAIRQLSHVMENVLVMIREGRHIPDAVGIDALLAGVDKLRIMFADILNCQQVTFQEELDKLNAILGSNTAAETAKALNNIPEKKNLDPDHEEHSKVFYEKSLDKRPIETMPVAQERLSTTHPAEEENRPAYETIRVNVDLIDKLMNLAGELVLGRNQLRQELEEAVYGNPKLGTLIQSVDMVTSEVQEKIMQMRMQPVVNLFNRFTRVVRDLSHQLSKEVELFIEGQDVELDKSILERLSDPMTHLIRNSLDHGIERPEERVKKGKDATGKICLKASHEGGQVNIVVTDDGRGIDPDIISEKAVSRGIISRENITKMSPAEKRNLALMPGFSTTEEVSEISGRGVGMDVVKTNIEKLGGYLEIESEKGTGTTVKIRLPLTLAIIPSLIVGAGGQRFAIPQINIKELVCVRAKDVPVQIEAVAGAEVLRLRDNLLPIARLTDILNLTRFLAHYRTGEIIIDRRQRLVDRRNLYKTVADESDNPEQPPERRNSQERRQSWHSDLYVVVLRVGENIFGVCVDELFDTEEIVVKPLSDHLKDVKVFAGATIMGDGRVAMILDVSGIAEHLNLRFLEINSEAMRRHHMKASQESDEDSRRLSVLLFNNSSQEQFAISLKDISRIEKVEPEMMHRVGNKAFLNYRGESLPLIRLEDHLDVGPLPKDKTALYVIVPKAGTPRAGILVSDILDTMESATALKEQHKQPGIMGSSFLEDRLTLFLNTEELLELFEASRGTNSTEKEEAA
jgi:two-component system chemotaxis sensor kinase CheA